MWLTLNTLPWYACRACAFRSIHSCLLTCWSYGRLCKCDLTASTTSLFAAVSLDSMSGGSSRTMPVPRLPCRISCSRASRHACFVAQLCDDSSCLNRSCRQRKHTSRHHAGVFRALHTLSPNSLLPLLAADPSAYPATTVSTLLARVLHNEGHTQAQRGPCLSCSLWSAYFQVLSHRCALSCCVP
jgi:hypothetical protein